MIEIHNLVKTYGDFRAVDDLSLRVEPGEIVGLVGPNGAGKTTTLRCLSGIIPPTSGTVAVSGHDLEENPVEAKRRLAFVPDEPHLFDHLTAWDYLLVAARLYGVADGAERAEMLLSHFGLADRKDSFPAELSRGMKQKLMITAGLLHRPEVLILDEPLTGLDPRAMRLMKDTIVEAGRNGAAVIVSSHMLRLVEEICGRVVIINHGKVVLDGTLDAIRRGLPELGDGADLEDVFLRATEDQPAADPGPVSPALWELLYRSVRGRVRRSLRLARQPKYLVGFVVGMAYFGWMFLRPFLAGDWQPGMNLEALSTELYRGIQVVAATGIALYLSLSWVLMPVRPSLKLRAPELSLLLPAPIHRREVITYGLLKSVPGILIGVIIIMVFFSTGSIPARAMQAANLFGLFLLWDFHGKGRNLWKARTEELPPARAYLRRVLMWLVVALFWTVAGVAVFKVGRVFFNEIQAAGEFDETVLAEIMRSVNDAARSGPLRILLAPLLWLIEPFFSRGEPSWLSWGFLLVVLAAHFRWVVWSQTRFEETLLEQERRRGLGKKIDRRLKQGVAARRSHPFPLKPLGRPEIAVFWKDLVVVTRRPRRFWLTVYVGMFAIITGTVGAVGAPEWLRYPLAIGSAAIAVFLPFFSGMMWSNGFRRDLAHLEAIRTWPVAPSRFVLAETLAPITQTGSLILGACTAYAATGTGAWLATVLGRAHEGTDILPPEWAVALGVPELALPFLIALAAFPFLVAIAAVSSTVECLAVLVFPGWLLAMDQNRGDPASMGQRILVTVVFGLVMILGMIPAGLVLGGALLAHKFTGIPVAGWEVPVLGLLTALPLFAETWLLVRVGGSLWKRLDASEEILEGFS